MKFNFKFNIIKYNKMKKIKDKKIKIYTYNINQIIIIKIKI